MHSLKTLRLQPVAWLLVGLVFGVGLMQAAAWSESPAFCSLCHVMTPEVSAHAASAHAQVDCGACHAEPGLLGFLRSKLSSVREALAYWSRSYALPMAEPAAGLPDTALTCARCHVTPADDAPPRLIVRSRYLNDPTNTRLVLYYTLDPDRAHWHVTHPITYLATDALRQSIPWVTDGTRVYSVTTELPPGTLLRMDCATCHNRVGHPIHTAEALLDAALAQGLLSSQVPYLRRETLQALQAPYPTSEAALAALQAFPETYRAAHPTLYPSYEAELAQAARVLPDLYRLSTFPEWGIDGNSYPNNLGHQDGAGCFRCHDGKHLAADGQRITQNCTTCHGVPQLQAATEPVPQAPFIPPPQPASHQAADWAQTHGKLKDTSCAHCHAPSFCTNPLCHAPDVVIQP